MGVHGNLLLAFAEQFRTVTYFNMEPGYGGGYGERRDVHKVRGIFQNIVGSVVEDANGNLIKTNRLEFWSREKLKPGLFIDVNDGGVYRIGEVNEWCFEGKFIVYGIKKLVGDDGAAQPGNPAFNVGHNSFG